MHYSGVLRSISDKADLGWAGAGRSVVRADLNNLGTDMATGRYVLLIEATDITR